MQDKEDGKIKFFGTDFTDIYSYIDNTVIYSESYAEVIEEHKKDILIKFLEYVKTQTDKIQVNGRNNVLFRRLEEEKLFFQGLVGVISYPLSYWFGEKQLRLDITLEIHSRFDVDKNENISRPYFLATMLKQEKELKTTGNSIEENSYDYFWDFLLVFKFANCLKNAYEKDYYRTYQKFERNDGRLKGSIDIARHIKENIGQNNGRIAYSYREKTINNYFNHLLVQTYFFIKEKFEFLFYNILESDEIISGMIKQLIYEIDYPLYGIKEITSKNMNAISHPFYNEYEQLREVCLKILRDEGSSIFCGDESEVEGILYYLPDLWENFLQYYLEDSKDYYMTPDHMTPEQLDVMIFDFNGDRIFKQLTKPDYVFFTDTKKENPFMILDAKFKPAWASLIEENKWDKYLAEDYNKCIRDMNSLNAHNAGIICPSSFEVKENQIFEHNISKYNTTDKFYTFPIYVPKIREGEDYESWEKEFTDALNRMIYQIKTTICNKKI